MFARYLSFSSTRKEIL